MGSEIFYASNQYSPQHSPQLIAAQMRKARLEAPGAECASILVVDDEKILADTMTEILNMAGFCAFSAYDGHTALEIAEELRPDYLLTDVSMPGMSGIELAISVRKIHPKAAILLFSGHASTGDLLEKARAQGHVFELLEKPAHPVRLIERLKKMRLQ